VCFKAPKTPDPPKVAPAPSREALAVNAEDKATRRASTQQGIFSNIRTSAFGDTGYGKNTEMVKFGQVGSVA
jgi:hypothetical protein